MQISVLFPRVGHKIPYPKTARTTFINVDVSFDGVAVVVVLVVAVVFRNCHR